jgi:hypothetical protein
MIERRLKRIERKRERIENRLGTIGRRPERVKN